MSTLIVNVISLILELKVETQFENVNINSKRKQSYNRVEGRTQFENLLAA